MRIECNIKNDFSLLCLMPCVMIGWSRWEKALAIGWLFWFFVVSIEDK